MKFSMTQEVVYMSRSWRKTDTGLEIAYNLNDLKMNKRDFQGSSG